MKHISATSVVTAPKVLKLTDTFLLTWSFKLKGLICEKGEEMHAWYFHISAPRSRTFPQLHPTSNTLSLHSYLYPAAQLCAASTAINTSNALFIWIVHTRCWHFDCKTHKRELTKIPNSSCPGLYTKKKHFVLKLTI